jgi:phosphate transport system substrate-binding protein
MDGVCVVVHPSNPVKELTTAQVRDIYMGKITNWRQLGGPNAKIVAISRDTSSGTYETFHGLVMKKQQMAAGVEYVNANPQAHARVGNTRGAIAYVGLGFVDSHVKALIIDKVKPTRRAIAGGTYPVSRPLFMFTNGYPKLGSMTHRFCTFYLTEKGQELVEAKGFVPLTNY